MSWFADLIAMALKHGRVTLAVLAIAAAAGCGFVAGKRLYQVETVNCDAEKQAEAFEFERQGYLDEVAKAGIAAEEQRRLAAQALEDLAAERKLMAAARAEHARVAERGAKAAAELKRLKETNRDVENWAGQPLPVELVNWLRRDGTAGTANGVPDENDSAGATTGADAGLSSRRVGTGDELGFGQPHSAAGDGDRELQRRPESIAGLGIGSE